MVNTAGWLRQSDVSHASRPNSCLRHHWRGFQDSCPRGCFRCGHFHQRSSSLHHVIDLRWRRPGLVEYVLCSACDLAYVTLWLRFGAIMGAFSKFKSPFIILHSLHCMMLVAWEQTLFGVIECYVFVFRCFLLGRIRINAKHNGIPYRWWERQVISGISCSRYAYILQYAAVTAVCQVVQVDLYVIGMCWRTAMI